STSVKMLPESLVVPLYTYAEADRLSGNTIGTAKRWLGPRDEGVSFSDLLELVAVGRMKELGFSLAAIRRVVSVCRRLFQSERPIMLLAFKTHGRDLFVHGNGELYDVLKHRGKSVWNEGLDPFLETLDYEDSIACRWWPMGKAR